MVRRVCIGRLPDGNYGMWCSAPGVDVMTVSNPLDGNLLTFNSNWTDIAKVHQSGVANSDATNPKVFWPDLGYKPFMEVRLVEGGRVYDDSFNGADIGSASESFSDGLRPTSGRIYPGMKEVFQYIYVAYKIPVPTG
jgi:hypothetical protein